MPDPVLMTATLTLDIHDYWHCATGRTERVGSGARVVRKHGLPLVPGRTVRGLLREAIRQAEGFGHVKPGATEWLFGRLGAAQPRREADLTDVRFHRTTPGAMVVDDATLHQAWRDWARTRRAVKDGVDPLDLMGETLHATRLDREGQVAPGSLRSMEIMPPMTLTAPLALDPPPGCLEPDWASPGDWRAVLATALPLLRGLGSHRNRGLGRVSATLSDSAGRRIGGLA